MKTIVTVTVNPTLDKSADVEHVMPEHKLRCGTLRYHPGGGGVNVAPPERLKDSVAQRWPFINVGELMARFSITCSIRKSLTTGPFPLRILRAKG